MFCVWTIINILDKRGITEIGKLHSQSTIYESIKNRLDMSFDEFCNAMNQWDITPLKENNVVIGGVLAKENEVHIGYGIKPNASIRSHLKKTLKNVIDNYGFAVTFVGLDNKKGLNFCKRLGFMEISQEQDKIMKT